MKVLVMTLAVLLAGCAFTAEENKTSGEMLPGAPRAVNARALGYGVFLPSCVLFCVATGQASQAEHGDAQAGDLTTTATTSLTPPRGQIKPRPLKPKIKVVPRRSP